MEIVNPAGSTVDITVATFKDLTFIDSLQKKFSNQVGFLPKQAIEEHLAAGHVFLARENGEPAGYILTRNRVNSARWCRPITQVAVAFDAQRRHLGLSLVQAVSAKAHADLLEGLQCWVREDLEAVQFFKQAGFEPICTRDPESARRKRLILFRKPLQPFKHGDHYTPPAVAGCKPRRIDEQRLRLLPRTATATR